MRCVTALVSLLCRQSHNYYPVVSLAATALKVYVNDLNPEYEVHSFLMVDIV